MPVGELPKETFEKKAERARLVANVPYEVLWNNRGRIIQAFPETKAAFASSVAGGCGKCKKNRIARSIVSLMMQSTCRNVEILRGVLPQGVLQCLRTN